MTKHQKVSKRFGNRDRDRLEKLFRQLGTDNNHEAEAARGRIESILQSFSRPWADLIALLGGGIKITLDTEIARDIITLGDPDTNRRCAARTSIGEFLAQHRKTWNDLVDAFVGASAPWLSPSTADGPVRVKDLILLVRSLLQEYVDLRTPHEYTMLALWALHTHVFRQFMVTPRMALRSPVAGCGKTQLVEVLTKLTARPRKFDSITTAAIVRVVDESHPTLLIDEADNLGIALRPNGRLRAVFNSGHRHGGTDSLVENGRSRDFSTFAPLLLALPDAIQGLPRTLDSRCITLTMRRSDGRHKLKRLEPYRSDPAFYAVYAQLLPSRNDAALNSDPEMPEGISNRLADSWRPLLSIADSLGWGRQAREALVEFASAIQDADAGILLLTDIRKVFDDADRMPSQTLIAKLLELDDTDWSEFRGTRGDQPFNELKVGEMALMLRAFGLRSQNIWPLKRTASSKSQKGFRRQQFDDAWHTYAAGGHIGTIKRCQRVTYCQSRNRFLNRHDHRALAPHPHR